MKRQEVAFAVRPLIDAYGDGGFRIGGLFMRGSMLLLPDRLEPWALSAVAEADAPAIAPLLALAGSVDFVLVGTGEKMAAPKELKAAFPAAGLSLDLMPTGAACRTYNVLLAEGRRLAAGLIAVP